MALTAGTAWRHAEDKGDPLLIDSILSKSEEGEVLKMLTIEGAIQEDLNGSIITTSSQMKSRRPGRLAVSMSPIIPVAGRTTETQIRMIC